ncbi:MAG: prepilin-type N-terminal cleavage/methylation domain-containing protein [Pseudomonadota bacterium]
MSNRRRSESPAFNLQRAASRKSRRGFSLLESLVAITILGLSLGALYQAVGGATRNLRTDERYAYAVELARSLVADHSIVPEAGMSQSGETAGGFRWAVSASPVPVATPSRIRPGQLQRLQVNVSWPEGRGTRGVTLHSVVAGTR